MKPNLTKVYIGIGAFTIAVIAGAYLFLYNPRAYSREAYSRYQNRQMADKPGGFKGVYKIEDEQTVRYFYAKRSKGAA